MVLPTCQAFDPRPSVTKTSPFLASGTLLPWQLTIWRHTLMTLESACVGGGGVRAIATAAVSEDLLMSALSRRKGTKVK